MEIIKYNEVYKNSTKKFLKTMYEIMKYSFPADKEQLDLETVYSNCIQSGGEFLILLNGQEVAGTVGVKVTDLSEGIGEVKRLFVLPWN